MNNEETISTVFVDEFIIVQMNIGMVDGRSSLLYKTLHSFVQTRKLESRTRSIVKFQFHVEKKRIIVHRCYGMTSSYTQQQHMSFSFVSFQISLPDGRLRSVLFILFNLGFMIEANSGT